MIKFTEILFNTDEWELFARDFLLEQGFYIESSPDRGADGGKDLLISEHLNGIVSKNKFSWLVSCKHFAQSNKSVNETDEQNILERLESFNADGFIGFYSTIASAALNKRLLDLKNQQKIKDYKIYDHKLIENYLIRIGYSELLQRYFPESYKNIKPLQLVLDEYLPIKCKVCNKDLLMSLFEEDYNAIITFVSNIDNKANPHKIISVNCLCKGDCDDKMENLLFKQKKVTSWNDISDLIIPQEFLNFVFSIMKEMREGFTVYTDEAFEELKYIITGLSQKVLRTTTEREKERIKELLTFPG